MNERKGKINPLDNDDPILCLDHDGTTFVHHEMI